MDDRVYSVFIAVNENNLREKLIDFLLAREDLKLSGIAKDGSEAYAKLSDRRYDLVLMDAAMPDMPDFDIAKIVDGMPPVIYTSEFEHYGSDAHKILSRDYPQYQISIESFHRSIDKFLSRESLTCRKSASVPIYPSGDALAFKHEGKHRLMQYKEIVYITAHGKRSIMMTDENSYEISMMLKDFEQQLPGDMFLRIHRQYMVNVRYISVIEYYQGGQYRAFLKDEDETMLPVGRRYAPELRKMLRMC